MSQKQPDLGRDSEMARLIAERFAREAMSSKEDKSNIKPTKIIKYQREPGHIFLELQEAEQQAAVRAAGINSHMPSSPRDITMWFTVFGYRLVPSLLRIRGFNERDVSLLFREGYLSVGQNPWEVPLIVRFSLSSYLYSDDDKGFKDEGFMSIIDLASASVGLYELFATLSAANRPFGVVLVPPDVQLSRGSVQFTLGGGSLFSTGIALLVACSNHLLLNPVIGFVAGGALVSVGLIELILEWKKKKAETGKTYAELDKVEAEKLKVEVEKLKLEQEIVKLQQEILLIRSDVDAQQSSRMKEIEIKKKELELLDKQREINESSGFAYSSLVPNEVVREEASRLGISEGYANHILNRSLPTFVALKQYWENISIK